MQSQEFHLQSIWLLQNYYRQDLFWEAHGKLLVICFSTQPLVYLDGYFPPVKALQTDCLFQRLNLSGRPVRSSEHLVLIGQNGEVCLITAAATVWHPQPNDGYQLCKQPPHPRSIFIVFEQQCCISWPPLSTTHTGHSKQKIHSIDPPVSPQLLFPNSHWGQITSALPFHPVTMAEQCHPLSTHILLLFLLLISALLSLHLPPKWGLDGDVERWGHHRG